MIPTLLYSDLHLGWQAMVAQAKACEAAGLTADALRWEAAALAFHKVLRAMEAHRILPAPKPLPATSPEGDVSLTLTSLQTEIEASMSALGALEVGVSITQAPQEPPDECPC